MKYQIKKSLTKWKRFSDVFAKTSSAVKIQEDRKAKRLYWKDKNLDAD